MFVYIRECVYECLRRENKFVAADFYVFQKQVMNTKQNCLKILFFSHRYDHNHTHTPKHKQLYVHGQSLAHTHTHIKHNMHIFIRPWTKKVDIPKREREKKEIKR